MEHIRTSVSRKDGSVPPLNQSGKLLDTPICFEVTASSDPSVLCGSRKPAGQWLQVTPIWSWLTNNLSSFIHSVFPLE